MELAVGAHQDMVALQGMGEDLQDVEEGGHHQGMEEGLRRGTSKCKQFQVRYKVSIANTQNCNFMCCLSLT